MRVRIVVQSALIAAVYVVLNFISYSFGLSNGAIQLRISEALVALVLFTPAAVPGITIGCFLANIFSGCVVIDVIFGTLATFFGVLIGYKLRKNGVFAFFPNIIINSIIIPPVLMFAYGLAGEWWYFFITIFCGEFLSCGVMGMILKCSLEKKAKYIFKK